MNVPRKVWDSKVKFAPGQIRFQAYNKARQVGIFNIKPVRVKFEAGILLGHIGLCQTRPVTIHTRIYKQNPIFDTICSF